MKILDLVVFSVHVSSFSQPPHSCSHTSFVLHVLVSEDDGDPRLSHHELQFRRPAVTLALASKHVHTSGGLISRTAFCPSATHG